MSNEWMNQFDIGTRILSNGVQAALSKCQIPAFTESCSGQELNSYFGYSFSALEKDFRSPEPLDFYCTHFAS